MLNDSGAIGLHARAPTIEDVHPNVAGNGILVPLLENAGFPVYFIPSSGYRIEGGRVASASGYYARAWSDGQLTAADVPDELPVGKAPDAVRVVRTRAAAPPELELDVPVVNGRLLRAIGASKWAQCLLFGEHMAPTVWAGSGESFDEEGVATIPTPLVVVKGDKSQGSRWVAVVDRSEASDAVASMRENMMACGLANTDLIIQAFQPGTAFDMLRGLGPNEREDLAPVQSDAQAELRLYCFASLQGSQTQLDMYGVYRVYPGQDNELFVPIDQASIPDAAWRLGEQAVTAVLRTYPVAGFMLAVDEYKMPDGSLRIREINARDPILAELVSDNPDFQRQQIECLAQLLVRLARGS